MGSKPFNTPSVLKPESFPPVARGCTVGGTARAARFQSVLSARSFCLRDSGAVAPSAPAIARKGDGGTLPRVHVDRGAMTQG